MVDKAVRRQDKHASSTHSCPLQTAHFGTRRGGGRGRRQLMTIDDIARVLSVLYLVMSTKKAGKWTILSSWSRNKSAMPQNHVEKEWGGIKGFLNNVKKTAELLLGHPLNMDANLFPQCNVEYNVEGVHKQCQHRNRGHSASCSVHTFWLESISKSKSFLVAFPRKLSQGLRLREGF